MSRGRSDRFIFSLANENRENYEGWRRSLRLAAQRSSNNQQANSNNNELGGNSEKKASHYFRSDYQQTLKETLIPSHNNLSFSLKPKQRIVDQGRSKLDNYLEKRRDEVEIEPASVLDAPGLRDDYYLNILDWSSQNLLAVALNEAIYIWNPERSSVRLLSQLEGACDYVSSLTFSADGRVLSMANSQGCLSSFDVEGDRKVRDYAIKDAGRIAAMTMCPDGSANPDNCLTVGTKSGSILHFDPRDRGVSPALIMSEHCLEVCGLKRSYSAHQLASGGNDNKVCIWDLRWPSEALWIQSDHLAAVRALTWCPWQGSLLATGAGTADRRIRFWNTSTNSCLRQIQCDSQVCGLRWSPSHTEIVSTHGFGSNELVLWHYPSLEKVVGIKAHETRVLQLAMSPDGRKVVTAAANEHLKFWDLFPEPRRLQRSTENA